MDEVLSDSSLDDLVSSMRARDFCGGVANLLCTLKVNRVVEQQSPRSPASPCSPVEVPRTLNRNT